MPVSGSDCLGQLLPWIGFIYSPLKCWHSAAAASVTHDACFTKLFMHQKVFGHNYKLILFISLKVRT